MIFNEYKTAVPYIAICVLLVCSILGIGTYQHLTAKNSASSTPELLPQNAVPATSSTDNLDKAHKAYASGNMQEAIAHYQHALKDHPQLTHILLRLGNAHVALNNYAQALAYYQSILAIDPYNVGAHLCAGVAQHNLKQYEHAVASFQKAIALHPTYYDAYMQSSLSLSSLHRYEEAINALEKAARIEPKKLETYAQLGYVYNKMGDTKHAIAAYAQALEIDPHNATALQGTGYSLRLQGDMHDAIPFLKKAIAVQPDHIDAHIGLAFCYWALGEYDKAWPEYEWRWKMHGMYPEKLNTPLLKAENIGGSSILLYYEQGMGDTLQYIRYAKELKKRGAKKIVCRVQKPLKKLLSLCEYVDDIVLDGDEVRTDYQAPLMSMPLILNTRADSIPCDIPYIKADTTILQQWQEVLRKDTNFKIGLCWHVDPIHEEIKSPLAKRSIPLALFAPLAQNKNVSFYSLQKMVGEDQLNDLPAGFNVISFGADFDKKNGSFMDCTAVISELDLVISVDTSVVHIAGALGKPVWTLLPSSPDPRFHTTGDIMPWYPSMRLFRTIKPYDWKTTIAQVDTELKKMLEEK